MSIEDTSFFEVTVWFDIIKVRPSNSGYYLVLKKHGEFFGLTGDSFDAHTTRPAYYDMVQDVWRDDELEFEPNKSVNVGSHWTYIDKPFVTNHGTTIEKNSWENVKKAVKDFLFVAALTK